MKLWYIASIVGAAISGYFFCWVMGGVFESALSYTWPHVTGKIISSEIHSANMKGRYSDYIAYWPEVHYEYEVNQVRSVGDRIRFVERGMSEEETKNIVGTYVIGKSVTVFFNPRDIVSSALEPGIWWPSIPMLLFLLVASVGMLGAVLFDFWVRRRA